MENLQQGPVPSTEVNTNEVANTTKSTTSNKMSTQKIWGIILTCNLLIIGVVRFVLSIIRYIFTLGNPYGYGIINNIFNMLNWFLSLFGLLGFPLMIVGIVLLLIKDKSK